MSKNDAISKFTNTSGTIYNRTRTTYTTTRSPTTTTQTTVSNRGRQFHLRPAIVPGNFYSPTGYYNLRGYWTGHQAYSVDYPINYGHRWNTADGGTDSGLTQYFYGDYVGVFDLLGTTPMRIPAEFSVRSDNKLLDRLASQELSIGPMVAELSETVSYFSQKAQSVARFAISIKTGNYSRALRQTGISKKRWNRFRRRSIGSATRRSSEAIAARWLEYGFAIVPTLKDLEALANAHHIPKKLNAILSLTTYGKASINESFDDLYDYSSYYVEATDKINYNYTGTVRTSCTYRVNNYDVIAQKALGLHAKTPLLWEVTPFSWLIDYVVGIGDYLSRLSATDGLTFVHGYRSLLCNLNTKVTKIEVGSWDYLQKKSFLVREGTYASRGYVRTLMGSFPKPQLEFKLSDLSIRQAANVTALGLVLSSGKSSRFVN